MNNPATHDQVRHLNYELRVDADLDRFTEPVRRWPRVIGFTALALALISLVGFAAVQFGLTTGLPGEATAAQPETAQPSLPDSPFLQHVKQAGVQSCSTVFPVLGQLLTNGTKYGVRSSWNDEAADKHAVQALVGMDYATGQYSGPAAGVVFAAPVGSVCEGTMVRVVPFATPCTNVPAMLPADSKISENLGQVAVYELGANNGQALLLPAGQSCVVISVASAVQ